MFLRVTDDVHTRNFFYVLIVADFRDIRQSAHNIYKDCHMIIQRPPQIVPANLANIPPSFSKYFNKNTNYINTKVAFCS